jgi:hypothetical protein
MRRDYSRSGLSIREALLEEARVNPPKGRRPPTIRWGELQITNSDRLTVPRMGRLRLEFLKCAPGTEQGVDVKGKPGFLLPSGRVVSLLRTWCDSDFEPVVEYDYESADSTLATWNVYKMKYSSGEVREEKWTENAGLWREEVAALDIIYHCSHGAAPVPDFESLVYRITIQPRSL